MFFLPADPEDVDCSPTLHHVSVANSQRACPGLGVAQGTVKQLGHQVVTAGIRAMFSCHKGWLLLVHWEHPLGHALVAEPMFQPPPAMRATSAAFGLILDGL